ncbi:ShlB/FhaC/HecB family hemolysin secretion/activation protein [Desulfobacterota bacterium M19]
MVNDLLGRCTTCFIFLIPAALMFSLLIGVPAQVQAQEKIDQINRAAEQIQREQQERQQQLLKNKQPGKQTSPQKLPEVKLPSLPKGGTCREIRKIVLTGVTLLPKNVTQALVAPYQGKCLYAEDIEKLLADILKAYIDRGYIAVRPYIQAQDLSTGRLEILILEGKVERLNLQDDGKHSINLTTAFPFVKGKPLNLRDIEQGLEQINRLASNNATMEISPGAESGESIINIINTPSFPLSAYISLNNLGSKSTGEKQGSITLSMDNPLHLNDFLTYTHSRTLFEPDRFRDSSSNSFFYSLPLGYWTLQQSYSFSEYRTPVITSVATLVARGDSETYRAELNWVAYRDQNQKLTTLLAINKKSFNNYLDDEFLSVSSRKLTIFDVGMNWNRRFPRLSVNLGLSWSKGLSWFGALKDPDGLDATAPHAQGSVFRYSGGMQVPFPVLGRVFSFSSQLTGQYAMQPLYGSEQITIGSYYSVRGFNRYSLAGDRGYFVRNELSSSLPKLSFVGITARFFLGLDAGRILGYKNTDSANLSGAAAGIRFAGKHLSAELSVAKSLSVPDTIEREPEQYFATVTANF